ncbi:gamma-tubulin complex component 2 [Acyrthosiphon pisum]|uniref:Gamma-tubulin complex component n=1 Tax=Acyrthosiphon pisum TaxID=7029 RepID=A0A8R1W5Z2_ACYPI|nr:gamma-tubulin complex component 2 [Acyrthosiphon pisum]|eukprot:XP_001949102.3 PREDICTED: gamma-tubulin complex component 2 [Acyrthosiphon pisum]
MDRARIPIEELITSFKSTSTVEDIFDKLEVWNRNDAQQIQLEHSKEHLLRKLLLHSDNPVKLKEKVECIDQNKMASKFMELIQEISEDKKLTVFLEKRYKEYERDISCSEVVQYYKDEIEKRNEFQKQRQMKKEIREKKVVLKKSVCKQTPLWKNLRKYQALDYFNIPMTSSDTTYPEEHDLVDDILSCLQGFHTKFINPNKLETPLTFNINKTIDPQFKCIVPKILRLVSAYTIICRYSEENRQSHNGYVNQALACYISKFIRDYLNFIICLESKHKSGELGLQSLSFAAQAHVYKMEFVARIVSTITQEKKKGGQTLSVLHEEMTQCYIDESLKKLLAGMVEVSTIPFFQSLEKWIFKGQVFDPCDEFMIKCGNLILNDDTEKYWNRCYTVRNEYVPSYLEKFKEIILRTGKYLNALYHCNIPNKSNLIYTSTNDEKLVYSMWCSDSTNYLKTINNAYMFASSSLLNVLLIDYDLMNRLKSIKRYFLLEQGDFVVHLLDVCDEELKKPTDDIVYNRLESLLDICLRVNVGCVDQYKDDIKMEFKKRSMSFQIFQILAIQTEKEKDYTNFQPSSNLLGIQSFCLGLTTQWPVSLIFNETVISNYQILFRLLLLCKNVERQLLKVWLCDKHLKKIPDSSAVTYKKAFNLRQNMLLFVQNLEYYMFEEVIETQWQAFTSAIQYKVKNVDELLDEQQKFLNLCLKNCMVTNPDLMKSSRYLLELCTEFSDYILLTKSHFNHLKLDFEKSIQILENKFTAAMIDLLKCIRKMSRLDNGNIIYNFLYRMDFNGMYTEQINMDDTILYI